jgi:hypothetical protein
MFQNLDICGHKTRKEIEKEKNLDIKQELRKGNIVEIIEISLDLDLFSSVYDK